MKSFSSRVMAAPVTITSLLILCSGVASGTTVTAADFNGNGKPDYLLYNAGTRQTAICYLNNNVFVSAAFGPTLPAGWSLVGQ